MSAIDKFIFTYYNIKKYAINYSKLKGCCQNER